MHFIDEDTLKTLYQDSKPDIYFSALHCVAFQNDNYVLVKSCFPSKWPCCVWCCCWKVEKGCLEALSAARAPWGNCLLGGWWVETVNNSRNVKCEKGFRYRDRKEQGSIPLGGPFLLGCVLDVQQLHWFLCIPCYIFLLTWRMTHEVTEMGWVNSWVEPGLGGKEKGSPCIWGFLNHK